MKIKTKIFVTGSHRASREGKGRYDLIPPYSLLRLAIHYQKGGAAFGDWDWARGQPLSIFLDSAERHLNALKAGLTDEDHGAAVAWNIFAFIDTQFRIQQGLLPRMLNDIPCNYGSDGRQYKLAKETLQCKKKQNQDQDQESNPLLPEVQLTLEATRLATQEMLRKPLNLAGAFYSSQDRSAPRAKKRKRSTRRSAKRSS